MTYRPLYKPEVGEIIPAEWYWDVVDDITYLYIKSVEMKQQIDCVEFYMQIADKELSDIYNYIVSINDTTKDIDAKVTQTVNLLQQIAPAKKLKSITKVVSVTPTPLFVDQLTIRRAIIKSAKDNVYLVYIGGADSQDFVLEPGEEQEIYVSTPLEIYLKSNGEAKIYALLEVVQ